jgi:hypothetical protein
MARSWIAMLAGSVMALSLITGCQGAAPPPEESSSASLTSETSADGSTGDGTTQEETTPQEETSGAEKTGATEAAQAVVTPRLPIGGDSPDDEDAEQCAQASFLGRDQNSIPPGVSIVVTGAVFTQKVFEVGGDGCTDVDDPPCLDGFIFTKDDTGQCTVPVRTNATRSPDERGRQDGLSLSGRLVCPEGQQAACRDLARRLEKDDQTIDLFAPRAETTESTTETTETTETTQSSSRSETSESTSGTTTSSDDGG